MRVDGGDNCHAFGDEHLLYILFVRPNSVHVYDSSTLLDDGVGLVPFMFPGSPTLHSLDTSY